MGAIFNCDFTGPASSLPHFWEHTIGSGHAPLALRADWQAQMRRSHEELGFGHVRFHGLLCDGISEFRGDRRAARCIVLARRGASLPLSKPGSRTQRHNAAVGGRRRYVAVCWA